LNNSLNKGDFGEKQLKLKEPIEVFNLNSKSLVEKRKKISYQTMVWSLIYLRYLGSFPPFLEFLKGDKNDKYHRKGF